ncbi:T9SS type A sorting domain-containing protein [Prevotella ihumii]|uniref:T9SS type A sorting domain-containing protein n=1 Tax=Prevotella ihumii TaxID=1917878 RepID=UPI000982344B|nr:T9SS type A sorting domain-containing protein [Prevotella ihumii]
MKKRLFSIVGTAIMTMGFSQVHAQTQLVVTPQSGAVGKYALTDIQKITFAADGMHIIGSAFTVEPVWKLSAIKDIRFVKTTDGIGKVGNTETGEIKISQRGDMLYINGLNAEQTDVAIYDLKGRAMLRTKVADGEGIDASSLQHGVFIIKVKNTTFKFVKQ